MCLNLKPEFPLVPVGELLTRYDELMLGVSLAPEFNGKPVQVLLALAVGKRELEKSVARLRSEYDKFW